MAVPSPGVVPAASRQSHGLPGSARDMCILPQWRSREGGQFGHFFGFFFCANAICSAAKKGSILHRKGKKIGGKKLGSIHSYFFAPDVFAIGEAMPISLPFPVARRLV
jgi:hypothetical protein